jgi:hypothetical protein
MQRKSDKIRFINSNVFSIHLLYIILVTDGVEGMCVDPGEMEAILKAGGVRWPGLLGGGKGGQLASDSGGG